MVSSGDPSVLFRRQPPGAEARTPALASQPGTRVELGSSLVSGGLACGRGGGGASVQTAAPACRSRRHQAWGGEWRLGPNRRADLQANSISTRAAWQLGQAPTIVRRRPWWCARSRDIRAARQRAPAAHHTGASCSARSRWTSRTGDHRRPLPDFRARQPAWVCTPRWYRDQRVGRARMWRTLRVLATRGALDPYLAVPVPPASSTGGADPFHAKDLARGDSSCETSGGHRQDSPPYLWLRPGSKH